MICRRFPKHTYYRLVLLLVVLFSGISAHAQLLDTRVSITLGPGSLDKCLLQLQQSTGLPFAYETTGLSNLPISQKKFREEKLSTILRYLLQGTHYHFEEKHSVIVVGPVNTGPEKDPGNRLFKGVIEDKETGERLQGVTVYDPHNLKGGTSTDKDGYFSLPANTDTLKLRLSYMSYKPVEIVLSSADAPMIRIKMDIAHSGLDSVLVVAATDITAFSPLTRVTPSVKDLSFMPRFSGDADLLSMVKITPGIQEANDGSGSLIVRGGAPDQNLLLLDDMNIYGATHLFGLLSSVNSRLVKDINIYKGAFPARYSGRISSVWDISLKNGDMENYHGALSAGTMAADFMLEGPIVKNKTTFVISGRRSYHDYYVRLFTPGLTFYFQDLNLKLRHKFSDKDQLFFSAYTSRDFFRLNSDSIPIDTNQSLNQTIQLDTRNRAGVLRWQHNYSDELMSNLSLSYSGYQLSIVNQFDQTARLGVDTFAVRRGDERISTGVSDVTGKFEMHYSPSGSIHDFEGGVYFTRHAFKPHTIKQITTIDFYPLQPIVVIPLIQQEIINDKSVNEAGIFLEDNLSFSSKLKGSAGVHINRYFYSTIGYTSVQPRLNLRYQIAKNWNLNAGYARMQQALHRLSISQTSLPADFWIPSTDTIKPQISNQVSLGLSGQLLHGALDLYVESYYKKVKNVAEYFSFRSNDTIFALGTWAPQVATGEGEAYGLEISMRKTKGRYRGWLSYALAWSNRTLPEVNYGRTFPYKYDRRHNLNLVNTYKIGDHLELSAVFSFQSKPRQPVLIVRTADLNMYAKEIRAFTATTDLRAYHRLDLGVSWTSQYRENVQGIWNFSVLNVYNRENAFFYFLSSSQNQLSGSSLLPISLSLSYTLTF